MGRKIDDKNNTVVWLPDTNLQSFLTIAEVIWRGGFWKVPAAEWFVT
jgi:hypothetical protein